MKLSNFILGSLVGIVLLIQPTNSAQPEIIVETKTEYIELTKTEYVTEYIKVNQTEPVMMETTAYTAGPESTGKSPGDKDYGITFTGTVAGPGTCAVDPDYITLGSALYIESYGYCRADDIGGAVKGLKVDVFVEKLSDALEFGREMRKVWILHNFDRGESGVEK